MTVSSFVSVIVGECLVYAVTKATDGELRSVERILDPY
jgi:hypothetical protein